MSVIRKFLPLSLSCLCLLSVAGCFTDQSICNSENMVGPDQHHIGPGKYSVFSDSTGSAVATSEVEIRLRPNGNGLGDYEFTESMQNEQGATQSRKGAVQTCLIAGEPKASIKYYDRETGEQSFYSDWAPISFEEQADGRQVFVVYSGSRRKASDECNSLLSENDAKFSSGYSLSIPNKGTNVWKVVETCFEIMDVSHNMWLTAIEEKAAE